MLLKVSRISKAHPHATTKGQCGQRIRYQIHHHTHATQNCLNHNYYLSHSIVMLQ